MSVRDTAVSARRDRTAAGTDLLLAATGIRKHFPVKRGALAGRIAGTVKAVDGIDLELRRGETLGLVGETGCGKSTFARCLLGLQPLTAGRIVFDGQDIANMTRREMRHHRREMQMVFQDPMGSLNPRRRVGSIVGDPLAVHGMSSGAARKRQVQKLMELVGLNPEHYNRFPMEFSGGQRQRIGVARALALRPKLIVCDEPVSALDVSIQAQILNLLKSLQSELGLTYLFISHDLGVVEHISDRVAVMYLGRLAEVGSVDDLYNRPRHPYTAALLSAAPVADPRSAARRQRIILAGDPPSPASPPSGCRFHPRCPKAQAVCAGEEPPLVARLGDPPSHVTACHFPVQPGDLLARAPTGGDPPLRAESPLATRATSEPTPEYGPGSAPADRGDASDRADAGTVPSERGGGSPYNTSWYGAAGQGAGPSHGTSRPGAPGAGAGARNEVSWPGGRDAFGAGAGRRTAAGEADGTQEDPRPDGPGQRRRRHRPGPGSPNVDPWLDDPFADVVGDEPGEPDRGRDEQAGWR